VKPVIPSVAHQATGRQRGKGKRPSGNNSSRKIGDETRRIHNHELNHAAVSPRLFMPEPLVSQNSA
jgi:hypothetical protein